MIHRADLNCANALACDPIIPILDCPETKAYIRASQAQRRLSSNSSLGENTGSLIELQVLNKDLIDKFIDLRYLAGINSLPGRRQSISKEEQIWKSDELYFTERSLLTLSNLSGPRNFVASCCIAALIFIDNHLRGIAFCARLIGRHVARLKLSMELFRDTSSSTASLTTPRAILWALYVGGIAAGTKPERGWFVAQLLEFCDILELCSWDDAEGVLKQFLWPLNWDFEGMTLWESIVDARLMRHDLLGATGNMDNIGPLVMDPSLTSL